MMKHVKLPGPKAGMPFKVCPMCKSTEIFLDGRLIAMGQFYTCNKCGYSGQLVIEEYEKAGGNRKK
jgi:predicted RNA-binding Zn-ribbon protein involved in translation (DUF1610 family)